MSDGGYLLDTNVISETRRTRADAQVLSFLASIREARVCLSVMTVGELRNGAELRKRVDLGHATKLFAWIETIERAFGDRILPVDQPAAQIWAELSAGRPRPIIDTLIAATALSHGMTLVTRNVADVRDTGVALIDPWA